VVHKAESPSQPPAPTAALDVIIPHRGLERHLRLCVDSIARQSATSSISVAIDQKPRCAGFLRDIASESSIQAFHLAPNPVGPYVARHHLGWVWQDSDDISLRSRLAMLSDTAFSEDAGMVGSHELREHEVRRKVIAVRYPLDASAALARAGPGHQMLFPTTMVRRDVFAAIGGFSTHRVFSLDVNFWLTASLHTRLRNVDEFLYVRRRRPGSLTTRRDVGTDSAIRRRLREMRTADYLAVREGRVGIEDTSLAISHRDGAVEFRPLTPHWCMPGV
jgi:hypothetical protein